MKVQIPIPEGYEIESFDLKTGEVKLKKSQPVDVRERIKTIDDILADNMLTKEAFDKQCLSLSEDEVAYRILKMLARSLNEGWIPDWTNNNEYKYVPYFEMRGPSGFRFGGFGAWSSGSGVGSRLCFKSRPLAEYAGKQFQSVWEQYMTIK